MNYQEIHNRIIDRARGRSKKVFVHEIHHVVPKCLGGSDSKDNIVALTHKEHFIVHLLLTKIYPDNPKIIMAWNFLNGAGSRFKDRYVSGRSYTKLKQKYSKIVSERFKDKKLSEEHKRKVTESLIGNKRVVGYHHTKEFKEFNSKLHSGAKRSEYTKAKIKQNWKGGRKRKICPDVQPEEVPS